MVKAGKLRHIVSIEDKMRTGNTFTWNAVQSNVPASVEPLSGSEFFHSQMTNSRLSHNVTIRYVAGIKPKMRVDFAGRFLYINSVVNPEERNIMLVLKCEEREN